MLQRGEKLDILVDKTDNLMAEADRFQKTGRALRNKMWWQSMRMKLLVGLGLVLLIVIIFLIACFSGGRNCTKKGGDGGGGR